MGQTGAGVAKHAAGKHTVAVAVTEGAPIFEISIPVEIFGRHRPGMAELGYDVRVCNPESGPVYAGGGFTVAQRRHLRHARHRGHGHRPGGRGRHRRTAGGPRRGGAGGARERRPRGVPVLRRLRPGRRRAARRPPRHHALAVRAGVPRPLPGRGPRSGGALHRPRRRAHQRGHHGRHRPVPGHGRRRPRRGRRQHAGPAARGADAPQRRPGAVRRDPARRRPGATASARCWTGCGRTCPSR